MLTAIHEASASTLRGDLASKPIPRASGWPLIGALPVLLRDPFAYWVAAHRRHGDVYALDLGPFKAVVLNHPRHAQHVLRDRAHNYRKGGAMWDSLRTMLGNGLVVSEGDFWLRQRRMMQPQFHRQRLAGLTDLMVRAIDESLTTWTPSGAPTDLLPLFNHLTMKVVVGTLFGTSIERATLAEVASAMTYAMDYLMVGTLTYGLPRWLPIPGQRRYRESLARFSRSVYEIIGAARRRRGADNHLLAMLLDAVDEQTGEGMSDKQLHDEVATLFLAGYETTSLALSWAFHYLTRHPEVAAKMQEEIDRVLGRRPPGFSDLPQLQYTRKVLQEVLRLRPPSYWVPRVAVEDDELDGHEIAAGTTVVSLTYMQHRHPECWPDAERFDPERFTPDHPRAARHPFAWIPFGAGQRLCIGKEFALMEGTLALAMVVQRFAVTGVPGRSAELGLSTTLRPKGGVHVHLAARG